MEVVKWEHTKELEGNQEDVFFCNTFIGYMKVPATKCKDCRGLTRDEFELLKNERKIICLEA